MFHSRQIYSGKRSKMVLGQLPLTKIAPIPIPNPNPEPKRGQFSSEAIVRIPSKITKFVLAPSISNLYLRL